MPTKNLFISALLAGAAMSTNAQTQTDIKCVVPTISDSVPEDLKVLAGGWYNIAYEKQIVKSYEMANVCSQLDFTNLGTENGEYHASFDKGDPLVTPQMVDGKLLGETQPLTLVLEFPTPGGPVQVLANYYIVATAGPKDDPTAMAVYACGKQADDTQDEAGAQIFYLSREPYFYGDVTLASIEEETKKHISNYDDFTLTGTKHIPTWCDYKLENSKPMAGKSADPKSAKDILWALIAFPAFVFGVMFYMQTSKQEEKEQEGLPEYQQPMLSKYN